MGLRERGQGSRFCRRVQTAEAGVVPASRPRCMSSAAGVKRSQYGIGMECSFPVQGPVSRGAQRSYETTNMLFFFFFLLLFICCSHFTAGSTSVNFAALNLLHLHYDSTEMTPTGTEKCMTTQRSRLSWTAPVFELMHLTSLNQ